jgi:hypothetical protein
MAARRHPVQHHRHRLNHRLDPAPRQAPRNGVKGHTLKLQIADYERLRPGRSRDAAKRRLFTPALASTTTARGDFWTGGRLENRLLRRPVAGLIGT